MNKEMQKQVFEILLMPIEVSNSSGFGDDKRIEIKKEGKVIRSTQTYWPEYRKRETGELFRYSFQPDSDMSDFACGFYKVLYKDILSGNDLVKNNGCMINRQFAGDTMTSVSKLTGLSDRYHCLANFWIIPLELGRKSSHELSKTSNIYNIQDFMDRFLLLMKNKFDVYKKVFPDYFQKIETFNQMSDIHFLCETYIDNQYNVKKYSDVLAVNTENYLWGCIQKRAEIISKSEVSQELWEYFNKVGIL